MAKDIYRSREDKIAAALERQKADYTALRYTRSDKAIKAAIAPFIEAVLDIWEGQEAHYTETPEGITAEGIARVFLNRIWLEKREMGEEKAALEALAEAISWRNGKRCTGKALEALTVAMNDARQDREARERLYSGAGCAVVSLDLYRREPVRPGEKAE